MGARRLLRGLRLTPVLLRRAVVKGWNDRLLGLSAEAAFWQLLSLPSLLLALLATLGYVAGLFGHDTIQRAEVQLERTLSRAFTQDVVDEVLGPTLHSILNSGRADIISIGFLLALWAGSSATATFVNTITIAYDMRDLRGAVHSRLLALGLFLGSVVVGVVLLPLLVLGPGLITQLFPQRLRPSAGEVIHDAYYPAVIVLVVVGLTTLYHLAPPRRLPWWRGVPGALVALAVFLGGSAALRSYIEYIVDRNSAYGTLAAPIAALLFFYVLALGVLLGAEFNAAIQAHAPAPARTPRVLNATLQMLPDVLPVPDKRPRRRRRRVGESPAAGRLGAARGRAPEASSRAGTTAAPAITPELES